MKEERIIRELECSLVEFIQIYKNDESQRKYHLDRGDINIVFNKWNDSTTQQQEISERSISFQAPINAPPSIRKIIGKDATTIVEKQKIQYTTSSTTTNTPLIINTHYRPDIMGDYFQVETEWIITPIVTTQQQHQPQLPQQSKCKLELILRTTFNMRFVGNVFELFIIKAAASSAAQYVDVVQDYLEMNKLNRLKQLKQQLQLHQQQQANQQHNNEQSKEIIKTRNKDHSKKIKKPIPMNLPIVTSTTSTTSTTTTTISNTNTTATNNNNNNNTNIIEQSKMKSKQKINNKKNYRHHHYNQQMYKNWTVDCSKRDIEEYLKYDMEDLKDTSQSASQSLLQVEISLSEMLSNHHNNNSQLNSSNNSSIIVNNNGSSSGGGGNLSLVGQLESSPLNPSMNHHHNHQIYQPSPIQFTPNSPSASSSSSTSSCNTSSSSLSTSMDEYSIVTSSSTSSATVQAMVIEINNLIKQMQINNRILRDKRMAQEEALSHQLGELISQYEEIYNFKKNNHQNNGHGQNDGSDDNNSGGGDGILDGWGIYIFASSAILVTLVTCIVLLTSIFSKLLSKRNMNHQNTTNHLKSILKK